MDNCFITGQFSSSFSTTIIGKLEKPEINLRDIDLRGRKVLLDADFFLSEPLVLKGELIMKDRFITNVEIVPKIGLSKPLEKPKKLDLFQVLIVNPIITHQQDVDGVRHGVIEGLLYAKLTDNKKDLSRLRVDEKVQIPIVEPIQVLNVESANILKADNLVGSSLQKRSGCLPGSSLLHNKGGIPGGGCLNVFKNGCLGLFLMLFLLALGSSLLKMCSNSITKRDNTEIVDTDDFINDKDHRIDEKDTTVYVDTKTIKEIRTLSLPNVQFFTNSSVLIPSSKKDLENVAVYLLENLDVKAKIIGHTDNVGSSSSNLLLSQNRAESVRTCLINLGVNGSRIKAIGKGSSEPKAENDTEEGRLMNRRVELELENTESIKK